MMETLETYELELIYGTLEVCIWPQEREIPPLHHENSSFSLDAILIITELDGDAESFALFIVSDDRRIIS